MRSNAVPSNGTTAIAPGGPVGDDVGARTGPLDRAIDLMVSLADAPGAELKDLSVRLGLPKSTVHRLLGQLEARSLVVREGASYRLGPLVSRLGRAASEADPLVDAAREPVARLAKELGETLFVVAARKGRLSVVHEQQGTGILRAAPTLGGDVPVHATAAGRLHLALAPEAVDAVRALERFTGATPTTRRALEVRVARAREQGWDENLDEWIEGLSVLATPIRSARGGLHGALCLACGRERYRALGGAKLVPRLLDASRVIERRLEGRKA